MSDGSCYYDKQCKRYKYNFSNKSLDLINILKEYLYICDIKYKVYTKLKDGIIEKYSLDIANKNEVEILHNSIGDKDNVK